MRVSKRGSCRPTPVSPISLQYVLHEELFGPTAISPVLRTFLVDLPDVITGRTLLFGGLNGSDGISHHSDTVEESDEAAVAPLGAAERGPRPPEEGAMEVEQSLPSCTVHNHRLNFLTFENTPQSLQLSREWPQTLRIVDGLLSNMYIR